MAGRQPSQSLTRYAGIQVQTSSLGLNVPVGWGTFRCKCNLVDYLDFKSKPIKAAGAGKGGPTTTTSYDYDATIILAICEGPIDSIASMKAKYWSQTSASGTVAISSWRSFTRLRSRSSGPSNRFARETRQARSSSTGAAFNSR